MEPSYVVYAINYYYFTSVFKYNFCSMKINK